MKNITAKTTFTAITALFFATSLYATDMKSNEMSMAKDAMPMQNDKMASDGMMKSHDMKSNEMSMAKDAMPMQNDKMASDGMMKSHDMKMDNMKSEGMQSDDMKTKEMKAKEMKKKAKTMENPKM